MAKRVGALWANKAKESGKSYLAGYIDLGIFGQAKVVIFKNDKKEKENQPDYNVVLSEPKEVADYDDSMADDSELPF